jgi:oligoendopeptidase F
MSPHDKNADYINIINRMRAGFDSRADQDLLRVNQTLSENISKAASKKTSVFEQALIDADITEAELTSLFHALESFHPDLHKYLQFRAGLLNRPGVFEWDIMPPWPGESQIISAFSEPKTAVLLMCEILGELDDSWSEILMTMYKKGLIDFSAQCNKTTILKEQGELGIFLDFNGDLRSFLCIAHETGHVLHCRSVKENSKIPFCFCELGSTCCEMLVCEKLKRWFPQAKAQILWHQVSIPDLVMSPVNFETERCLYENSPDRPWTQIEIEEIEKAALLRWFGISSPDKRPCNWQRGFYPMQPAFYNYQYTIGYLLACFLCTSLLENNEVFMDIKDLSSVLTEASDISLEVFVRKVFKSNSNDPDFWKQCLNSVKGWINDSYILNERLAKL